MLGSTAVIGYLIAGLITAGITMYVFPAVEGFRPKMLTVITAVSVFTAFWPVLVLLAIWYNATSYYRNSRQPRPVRNASSQ